MPVKSTGSCGTTPMRSRQEEGVKSLMSVGVWFFGFVFVGMSVGVRSYVYLSRFSLVIIKWKRKTKARTLSIERYPPISGVVVPQKQRLDTRLSTPTLSPTNSSFDKFVNFTLRGREGGGLIRKLTQ